MVQSQLSLNWNDYKSNICNGLSSLQQNGEMVDMTLAADGHIVKVHQVVLALASPYLKELITSAPCQHPVIFLNDVSHMTLTALLEYIYTGEVLVAQENLPLLVKTAKNLHIKGFEDLDKKLYMKFEGMSRSMDLGTCHISRTKQVTLPETEPREPEQRDEDVQFQVDLPDNAKKQRKRSQATISSKKNVESASEPPSFVEDTAADQDWGDDMELTDQNYESTNEQCKTGELQYSVSERGSLQVILNRYIYNLIYKHCRSKMRRWRCIDYRKRKCPAFLITNGNVVLNRGNIHNHTFHDKKILQKIQRQAVYSAISDVKGCKEKNSAQNTKFILAEEVLEVSFDSGDNTDGL